MFSGSAPAPIFCCGGEFHSRVWSSQLDPNLMHNPCGGASGKNLPRADQMFQTDNCMAYGRKSQLKCFL
jgi:hypothetical protein